MKVKRIRKLKRKKKYNANVSRKRQRDKLRKLPDIPCEPIKKAWEDGKSTRHNLKEMGLAYDANQAIGIPNKLVEKSKKMVVVNEESSEHEDEVALEIPAKNQVSEALEADARAPRRRLLRLPKAQARFLSYLIKKYSEDYEAMSRDKKNYYQLTWKQIRAKIKLFKGIPEQYNEYLRSNDVEN